MPQVVAMKATITATTMTPKPTTAPLAAGRWSLAAGRWPLVRKRMTEDGNQPAAHRGPP